jgi:predicted MPP superfamily phosphohydrolase
MRLLQPFVLVVTALVGVGYAFLALRLGSGPGSRVAILVPFFFIWIVPVRYWGRPRDKPETRLDQVVHQASYLSMAFVSFLLVLTLAKDALVLATWGAPQLNAYVREASVPVILGGSVLAVVIGALTALRGPGVERVDVRVPGLHPDLEGFRIVQISDLHVGRTIRRRYVERTVERARALSPQLVALTGDMVDGSVARLESDVEPLRALGGESAFFILGNHDCYSGAAAWIRRFEALGMRVLLNSHVRLQIGKARMIVGGVVDPAYGRLRPRISIPEDERADFKLLLAHNPRLAPLGARAGFDLQLSGHTHAGQFFPWTLAVRLVHAPHAAGLSREGAMQVYVSAGTGTWGPPVRFGTSPEITLLRLVAA